jgi:hypothetical protein
MDGPCRPGVPARRRNCRECGLGFVTVNPVGSTAGSPAQDRGGRGSKPGSGTRLQSGADFEDEVERGLGRPTEPGVAGFFKHFS